MIEINNQNYELSNLHSWYLEYFQIKCGTKIIWYFNEIEKYLTMDYRV